MKRIVFLLFILCFSSVMNANSPVVYKIIDLDVNEILEGPYPVRKCDPVESDCGSGGFWFACGNVNSDGDIDHEIRDELRQILNEAFCGY